jgi:hypothetical protein
MPNPVIEAAYGLANSRQMCCRADLDLLIEVLRELDNHPRVVQLGAGSGTMALAIFGARDDVGLWSIDNDQQALNWELQALKNAEVDLQFDSGNPRYVQINDDSALAGRHWQRRMSQNSLVIIDADHSFDSVVTDVYAWRDHCGLMFIHDYDGTTAPQRYPGVRQACDAMWGETPPLYRAGWSAVFRSHADGA